MGVRHGACAGDKLVISAVHRDLASVVAFLEDNSGRHKRRVEDHIDFIKGDPVFHESFIAFEQCSCVSVVAVRDLTAAPSAVFRDQVHRNIEMIDGHERFDAVLLTFGKDIFVELQARFIRLRVVSVRVDPRPGDGHPVGLEAQLREQLDIALPPVVHVDGFLGRIEMIVVEVFHLHIARRDLPAVRTRRNHIDVGKTPSALIVSAFTLIRSRRAAP